ncbi:MAG: hypothetical protein Q9221_005420 [Calogaya cf. arnoldii]
MVKNSDEPGQQYQSRYPVSAAHASHSGFGASSSPDGLNENSSYNGQNVPIPGAARGKSRNVPANSVAFNTAEGNDTSEKAAVQSPIPQTGTGRGETPAAIDTPTTDKPNIFIRFYRDCKAILFASWVNALLVFVPVAIACEIAHVSPTIIFAMNAIAIIPLAGLLSYATESVASEMGDTIGALMNVTFGNAVELIIFIALVKNEIRIVQASLLGSILANLLLILGMGFLVGGLRYREQSVTSGKDFDPSPFLFPKSNWVVVDQLTVGQTAFHASFTENKDADAAVLKILLLVYVLYLLFQLKSHSYLYASMPQHVIDEESHPGVLAEMLNSSSSSASSSSSSSSDTDGSSRSHTTAKRIKRVLRGRRRRKSSASSKDTPSAPSTLRTPSASTFGHAFDHSETTVVDPEHGSSESVPQPLGVIASGDEADTDGESRKYRHKHVDRTIKSRDFQKDKRVSVPELPSRSAERKTKRSRKPGPQHVLDEEKVVEAEAQRVDSANPKPDGSSGHPEELFVKVGMAPEENPRRPFGKRGISNVLPAMPAMPRMLSTTVFSAANPTGLPTIGPTVAAAPANSLHRSTSLPSRLNRMDGANTATMAIQTIPYVRPVTAIHPTFDAEHREHSKKHLSRTSAIILLIASTGLVAVCADFLVESINYLVDNTGVNEAFIGLIVLPIVGNAAEHVTAVIAAGKNKMDLAIGIAVGSSIQIALFVTPVIVLLGWILQKEMSLYFSIFETVSLFVSAFIINFLILDGKSNYLEGALLIAAYVIIASDYMYDKTRVFRASARYVHEPSLHLTSSLRYKIHFIASRRRPVPSHANPTAPSIIKSVIRDEN